MLKLRYNDYSCKGIKGFVFIPLYLCTFLFSFHGIAQQNTNVHYGSIKTSHVYAQNSVLENGTWIKLKVNLDKVYKITYDDLVSYGIDPSSINPQNIRIFGNGGGMLPESNAADTPDDLIENAIYVKGESDGHFDTDDYILFYGQSPVKWSYDSITKIFKHSINSYSDDTYYFLTYDQGAGKRIQTQSSSTLSPNVIVTKFNDYAYHEKDSVNLIRSGREWYGEYFDAVNSYSFGFNMPGIDQTVKSIVRTNIAARGLTNTKFTIYAAGSVDTLNVLAIPGSVTADFARFSEDTFSFYPAGTNCNITISKTTNGNTGWLNFVEINTIRNLNYCGPQMLFRDVTSVGNGNLAEYRLNSADSTLTIWDITAPFTIKKQDYVLNGELLHFRLPADLLHQFIVFGNSGFSTPQFVEKVLNQNLHSQGPVDMIIIAHPNFLTQANRLAAIHADHDNFSVLVVTPQEIYNEFSSGSQDVSAIRNFVRMIYERSSAINRSPRYLLLFGSGSYDYKDHFTQKTDLVPAYESYNSLLATASYVTDDFYGLMDYNEGFYANGDLDIGIGRLPARTVTDAKVLVDKIEGYLNKTYSHSELNGCTPFTEEISGDWRNKVCFVADDEDNNLHIGQAEELANTLDTANDNFNINKIYLDAYVQITNSNGPSYPDAQKALNKQVQDGALVINYTGHGGETGWTAEKVMELSDINSWTNIASLPAFVTATCEFSRFDDPERVSAGEMVLLSARGGGIALLTTTRVAFSNSNFSLNKSICKYAFKKQVGEYEHLGDIIRLSKVENGSIVNIRNFVLLGDPALKLSYPENDVVTTTINGQPAYSAIDTLKAFSKVTITGIIQNPSGAKLTDFNGLIYPTVYDKKYFSTTLANDPQSGHYNFYQQNHILYKGKATVTNGNFSFSFVLPKDMDETFGQGKISYYAHDGEKDAAGYYDGENFILGGVDSSNISDLEGPSVRLFLNDSSFIYGSTTNNSPLLLAYLADSNGINVSGINFGHDITAVLDDNTDQTIVLNDYYTPTTDTYKSGVVLYPFKSLAEGLHTLSIKAWDIADNSAEANTEFMVSGPSQLELKNIYNYPNPFTDETRFYFQHNQPCCDLDVDLEIYTITGTLIKTFKQIVQSTGTSINSITWDGRADGGTVVSSGVYPYHILVKTHTGSYLESYNKLIIL